MKNIMTILKHEFITIVSRRSFLITLFLLPLISIGVFLFTNYMNRDQGGNSIAQFFAPEQEATIDGYIDQSSLIQALPGNYEEILLPFSSEAEAEKALQQGDIIGYYVIPADYLETGSLLYVQREYRPFSGLDSSEVMEYVLNYNLLGQDQSLADRIEVPFELERVSLTGQEERNPNDAMSFFVPYIVTFLFYMVIFGSASLMLNSITSEKENRVMEVLMTSISPMEMLTGKMIALGLVGLLQTMVWSSTGLLILKISGNSVPAGFHLDASILLWGALFFILGYAVFASFMAGAGALVPNLREASQATMVVLIPLLIPLMLISSMINRPNSLLVTILSLFPLTSPVAMMTRLSATTVPFWQILVALGLLVLTAYFVIRGVAGLFRAQNLLSGQKFSLKVFLLAMLGKA